ncbi:LPXTG cell wall anchor domain-containing protein [Periweissella cryptocerci]|uniref:LPXTG cell wall anchor domain-containing protein n=1 Tax=Periweissella cryptocerci TaxID=2506420 RepID=A0A4V1AIC7_9LACO|nr:LPXTG cell wall anchor domain-containing protein [Periweissella cryptocerci]QBO35045.1 LPXTG cell wall anchor domain-containing protein [Periweissella cryptocerci]
MKRIFYKYVLLLLATFTLGMFTHGQIHAATANGDKYVTNVTWKKKNDDSMNSGTAASNKLTAQANKNMLLDYALDFNGETFEPGSVITLSIPAGFSPEDFPANTIMNGLDEKGKAFPFAVISIQNGQLQLVVTSDAANREMKTGDVRFKTDFTATASATGGFQTVTFPGNNVFNYSYVKSTSDSSTTDSRWITKTGSQDTANGGAPFLGSITWTIRVNNNKGQEIDNAAITDIIPNGLTLDPSSVKVNLYNLSASASVTSKTPLATVPASDIIVSQDSGAQKLTVRLGDLSEFTANKTVPVAAMITYTTTVNDYYPNKVSTYTNTAKLFGNDNPLDMSLPDKQTQPFISGQGSTTLTSNHDGEIGGNVTAGTVMVAQPPYNVAVTKYGLDGDTRSLLSNAEFTLTDLENNNVIAVEKSDANGHISFVNALNPSISDTYKLMETAAPDGYEIFKGAYVISLKPAADNQWAVNIVDTNDTTSLLSSTNLADLTTDTAITSMQANAGVIDFSILDQATPKPEPILPDTPVVPEPESPVTPEEPVVPDDSNVPDTDSPEPDSPVTPDEPIVPSSNETQPKHHAFMMPQTPAEPERPQVTTITTEKTPTPAKPVVKVLPQPLKKVQHLAVPSQVVKRAPAPQPLATKKIAKTGKVTTSSKNLPHTGIQVNFVLVVLGAFLAMLGGLTWFTSRRQN